MSPTRAPVILSVDWDYFFVRLPEASQAYREHVGASAQDLYLYDWGHRESPLFIDGPLWAIRAQTFQVCGKDLPLTTGEEEGFWDRFTIKPEAPLYLAESHLSMLRLWYRLPPLQGPLCGEIWNYDAHHDLGYGEGPSAGPEVDYDCSNWGVMYKRGGWAFHQRYPVWRDMADDSPAWVEPDSKDFGSPEEEIPPIDAVFICRSGAWVPPWLDQGFQAFVLACPVEPLRMMTLDLQWGNPIFPRQWTEALSEAGKIRPLPGA